MFGELEKQSNMISFKQNKRYRQWYT